MTELNFSGPFLLSVEFRAVCILEGFVQLPDNVETVLSVTENTGMMIKLHNSFFMYNSIEYLYHVFKPQEPSFDLKAI